MTVNAYPSATQVAHVQYDGEMLAGPTGWSSERTSAGHYTVHHDIDDERYAVIAQVFTQPEHAPAWAMVTGAKAGHLTVKVANADGDADHDVEVVVFV